MSHPVNQDGTPVGYGTGLPETAPAAPPVTPPRPPAAPAGLPSEIPEHGPMPGTDDLGRPIVGDSSLDPATLEGLRGEWGPGEHDERIAAARHAGRALNQATSGVLDALLSTTPLGDGHQATILLDALATVMADVDPLVTKSIPTDRRESALWALDYLDRQLGSGSVKDFLTEAKLDQDPRMLTVFAAVADMIGGRVAVGGVNPVSVQGEISKIMSDQKFLKGEYPKAEHERISARLRDLYSLVYR